MIVYIKIDQPEEYPEDARYHYYDVTGDYECMAIEYLYWAQVAKMDLLNVTINLYKGHPVSQIGRSLKNYRINVRRV